MPVVQNNLRNVGLRHSSTQHLKRKQNKHHQQFFHLISIPVWLLKGHLYRLTGSWINMWRFSLSLRLNAASHCSHENGFSPAKKNKQNSVTSFYGNSIVWSPVLYGHDFGRSHIYYGQKSFSIDVFCSCYCIKNHISFTVRCVNRLTVKMGVNCK